MFRKIAIIMTAVFFSTLSPEVQVLVVLFIIVINEFVQIRVNPYYTPTLNQMESYSLQIASLTLYIGMFYVTGQHYAYMEGDAVSWTFLTLLVVPNILFFGFWVLKMREELLKMLYKLDKPLLFRLLAWMSP